MEDKTSITLRNVSDIGTTREEIALDARSARGRTFTSGMKHLTFRTTSSFVCKKTKSVEEEVGRKKGLTSRSTPIRSRRRENSGSTGVARPNGGSVWFASTRERRGTMFGTHVPNMNRHTLATTRVSCKKGN